MNPELRLDRLERVLKLAIRAGYRERLEWRRQSREQTEKINMVIAAHLDAMDHWDKRAAETNEQLVAWQKSFYEGLAAFRAEFSEGLAASRAELNEGLAASRAELNEGLAASRAEFREGQAAFRAELNEGLAASRAEFNDSLAASRAEFDDRLAASQAEFDARMNRLLIAQDRTDKKIDKLAEEHAATERSLKAFLDGLRKGQNGNSST